MPYTADQFALPFQGRSPRARHNSFLAAESQRPVRGRKKQMVLAYIKQHGLVTRQGLIDGLGINAGTACSLLGALIDEHRVQDVDTARGKYGRPVSVYSATFGPELHQ